MTTEQNRTEQPAPPNSACARCGRSQQTLRRCSLTGARDHARKMLLCDECIQTMLATSPDTQRLQSATSPVMSEQEKQYETRRQKAFARLGTDHPICACCRETDWRCLELHHIAGKDFDQTTVIVCRNCHGKLSGEQKDHPAKLGEPPISLERIAHFIMGLADMLVMLAGKLREFGQYLIEQARLQIS